MDDGWWFVIALAFPFLATAWPALQGAAFSIVLGTAAMASMLIWGIVLFVAGPAGDSGPLQLFLTPFLVFIHTTLCLGILGVPWAIIVSKREEQA